MLLVCSNYMQFPYYTYYNMTVSHARADMHVLIRLNIILLDNRLTAKAVRLYRCAITALSQHANYYATCS